MSLDELIAELETTNGPSRELDDLVWGAGRSVGMRWRDRALRPEYHTPMCGCGFNREHEPDGSHWQSFGPGDGGPNYTRSVDAALTLIPEGSRLDFLSRRPGGWDCLVLGDLVSGCAYGASGRRTAALAVCLAALKARRNGETTTTGEPS